MPFYYDINRAVTTNGTTQTESAHLRFLTVANQLTARLMSFYPSFRSATVGGATLRVKTGATAGSGGTAQTPSKRNPANPAASTTVFNDATAITPGGTLTVRMGIGFAQAGSPGGWTAMELDDALAMQANGGANGNAEVYSIAVATSVLGDITVGLQEN